VEPIGYMDARRRPVRVVRPTVHARIDRDKDQRDNLSMRTMADQGPPGK